MILLNVFIFPKHKFNLYSKIAWFSSKGAHNRNFAQFNNCNLDFIVEIFNALTMNDN